MHNIEKWSYPVGQAKEEIFTEVSDYVGEQTRAEHGGCKCGLDRKIRFYDNVEPRADYNAASQWLDDHDEGRYDCLAVRYRSGKTLSSATLKKAEAAYANAVNAQLDLENKVIADFYGTKSLTVGCKQCGSSLSRKWLKAKRLIDCPLCGNELLSATAQERMKNAAARVKKAENALNDEKKKLAAKAGVKDWKNPSGVSWLVKFEYHT